MNKAFKNIGQITEDYDVAIIGAGVVGAFIAREISRYNINSVVLEGAADVAAGASRANSGIVHAGFDAPIGSLKARFNLQGNLMMEKVCDELGVKFGRIGSLVVAYSYDSFPVIKELLERGESNGVKDLEVIGADTLRELEPNISTEAVGALFAPTAGIVCPYELNIAAIGNAMDNGVRFITNFYVDKIVKNNDYFEIFAKDRGAIAKANGAKTNSLQANTVKQAVIKAKIIINCAGINADTIARLVGDDSFKIGARKGEYLLIDREKSGYVNHTIFSCPTKAGKGVLISPTVDGNIIVGPTSREIDDKADLSVEDVGRDEILFKAQSMCSQIPFGGVITSFAGLRAYSDRGDFIIQWSGKTDNLYNVAGIESPGLTSAPAIGEYVASEVRFKLGAQAKNNFNAIRSSDFYFKNLDTEEQNKLISERAEFGKIICRCEQVTLGEILDCVRRNPKPTTIDGIKLRTRAGMGRCQGGFCSPYVLEILMKELGLEETQVTKNGGDSWIIKGRTK